MSTDPKHVPAQRTSPLPFFALLAVFTIAVLAAVSYLTFGPH